MAFKDDKEHKEDLEKAAEKSRKAENPSDEINEDEDRKVSKGKDLERDDEGIERTQKEIQDAYE